MNGIKKLFNKYKEILIYLIFGVLTTAVNLTVFFVMENTTALSYLINNSIAWMAGVIFAFITNKFLVFKSKSRNPKTLFKEASEFLGARLFSFAAEELGLWLLVDILGLKYTSLSFLGIDFSGEFISKMILAVVVVIINYIFSKFIIFKKN